MKTEKRKKDDVTILDLKGKLTIGKGDVLLRKHIDESLGNDEKKIILNMKDVSYMDSSGVGELVSSFTSVNNRGGKLKLMNLSTKVHDLLQITQLLRVFEIFDNEDEAVGSFSS
jgi:anti-sigma B factor antagonist